MFQPQHMLSLASLKLLGAPARQFRFRLSPLHARLLGPDGFKGDMKRGDM